MGRSQNFLQKTILASELLVEERLVSPRLYRSWKNLPRLRSLGGYGIKRPCAKRQQALRALLASRQNSGLSHSADTPDVFVGD